MDNRKTSDLENILLNSNESDVNKVIEFENMNFKDYMKEQIRKHGFLEQEVFLRADISERYGYKLINQEKHTIQRDTILRLCYASKFTLEETQRALKLYGMSPLYVKVKRDAILMKGFTIYPGDILDFNMWLRKQNIEPLRTSN